MKRTITKAQSQAALKYIKNTSNWAGREIKGYWIADGYQYITNGASAFKISEEYHFPELPAFAGEGAPLKVDRFFTSIDRWVPDEYTVHLTQVELKAALASWRADKDKKQGELCGYQLGNSLFNAVLLLEVLKILGAKELHVSLTTDRAPGYMRIDGREAIVMPLRKSGQKIYNH